MKDDWAKALGEALRPELPEGAMTLPDLAKYKLRTSERRAQVIIKPLLGKTIERRRQGNTFYYWPITQPALRKK